MKHLLWILVLSFPLALTGCAATDEIASWFGDDDVEVAVDDGEPEHKYVTVIVKDRYGFRIKDPMGQRTTGGSCGLWKDNDQDTEGVCCWSTRGECACPCPE